MAVPQPYDVIETGKDLLIDFWKDKPVMQGLLKSQLREIQKLEDLTFQLLNERNVNDAVGVQLNVIGSIVGEDRQGRSDVEYREAILNRIALNRSDGTPPVILDLLSILSGSSVPNIFEHYPASFIAYVDEGASHNLAKTLKDISAAGVDTRLMFDQNQNSFVGARTIPEDNLFTTNSFAFEVDNTPSLFAVEGDKVFPYEGRSVLPHSKQIEAGNTANPLARTINATNFSVSRGFFDTGSNMLFAFEDGSIFEYIEVEEI